MSERAVWGPNRLWPCTQGNAEAASSASATVLTQRPLMVLRSATQLTLALILTFNQ